MPDCGVDLDALPHGLRPNEPLRVVGVWIRAELLLVVQHRPGLRRKSPSITGGWATDH